MTIKIGSARIDERGKASGGSAGDQSGKEVSTQNYYKHSKGWYVLRPILANAANKIAQDMKWACSNSKIGYDQGQRLTLYNVAEKVGFNCSKVTTKCETDCSALVRVCCAYAGIKVSNFRTTNERIVLLNSNAFVDVTSDVNLSTGKGLCVGDVLVTRSQGHTVIVVSGGSRKSDINLRCLEFQKAYNKDYNGHLEEDGMEGSKTKEAESKVIIRKIDTTHHAMVKFIQKYVGASVDGDYGSESAGCVKAYQKAHGLEVDGVVGAKTLHSIITGK